jgi:phage-related minor tail protein
LITAEKATAAGASEQVARNKATEAGASQIAADQSAAESQASALMAKRYTNGGVVPEDVEDNAKWYYQQAKDLKAQVDQVAKISIPRFRVDPVTMKLVSETEALAFGSGMKMVNFMERR